MNALSIVHETIRKYVKKGSICNDATAGRGYDTAFLCELVGNGEVLAFDIQQEAIDSTEKLLKSKKLSARLVLDSHENISEYAKENSVDCIVFNLGYLPNGNHSIYTKAHSTISAIEAGLRLLKKGGLMSVTIYYGGDSGYDEINELMPYLKSIDDKKYQVVVTQFYNWKNDPPIPVFIIKN